MRWLTARTVGALCYCTVVARAETASTEPRFRTQIANCPEEVFRRLPAIVKLEIDVLLRERGPTRAPPQSVGFRCEEDTVRLEVTVGGSSRSSIVDLSGLASEHRARALALAAAELLHSMSSQAIGAEPTPSDPTSLPPGSREPTTERAALPPARAGSSPRPVLLLGGLVELVGRPSALLLGARLELFYPLGAVVVPAITVDGAVGGLQARSANVAVQSATAAAHLYVGTTTGRVRWDVGPGASIGWVHLAGKPQAGSELEGHSIAAAWGGPELRGRIAYFAGSTPSATGASGFAPARSPTLALELGGGLVALPVRGMLDGTERIYSVDGVWASICAEVGLGL